MEDRITTLWLVERVKSLINNHTNYGVAKALGVKTETARCWYVRKSVMEDTVGIRVAEMLNLDPETVLLWLQVERVEKKGNDKLSQHWRHIAEQIAA